MDRFDKWIVCCLFLSCCLLVLYTLNMYGFKVLILKHIRNMFTSYK